MGGKGECRNCMKTFDGFLKGIKKLEGMGRTDMVHAWGPVFYGLIKATEARHVLEVGPHRGMTSIWLGRALEELGRGTLTLVDNWALTPDGASEECLRETLETALSDPFGKKDTPHVDIRIWSMPSGAYYPREQTPIDFAFIDGDHSEVGLATDLIGVLPLLSERAILCLHDTNVKSFPWIARMARDRAWAEEHGFDAVQLWPTGGLGMFVRRWSEPWMT